MYALKCKICTMCSVFHAFYLAHGVARGALRRLWTCSVEVQQSTLYCLTQGLQNTQFRVSIGKDCVLVISTKWEISYVNLHLLPQRPVYQYSLLCMSKMQWSQWWCSMQKRLQLVWEIYSIASFSPGKTFHCQTHQLSPSRSMLNKMQRFCWEA